MKQQVMKEVHVCDRCGNSEEFGIDACLGCGVEHCYECKKVAGRKYAHGVYVCGSGDGYYCTACDLRLTKDGTDAKHAGYREVALLRQEAEAWSIDFRRRQEAAEKRLSEVQPNAKGERRTE